MTTARMGLASNSFLLGHGLPIKYAGKALYAGLAATTGSVAGQITESLMNDGNIGELSSHLKDALPAAGIAVGVSILTSAFDYLTWNKFVPQTRVDMLNEEFNANMTYDSKTHYYGYTRNGNVSLGDLALENPAIARNTAAHELSHRFDFLNFESTYSGGISSFYSKPDRKPYSGSTRFTEFRAHTLDMRMTPGQFLPTRYYNESRLILANSYGFQPSSYYSPPLTPFNILANLFR